MCLGVYLCSEAALPLSTLNRSVDALALAPEPAPWAVLSQSCVVVGRGGGCAGSHGGSCGCLLDPEAAARPAASDACSDAARDLRRLIDCAAKAGKTALLVYRIGDETKTPEEASVGCASYFGDDGAWLAGALERPKIFWVGAPAARPDAESQRQA